MILLDIFIEKKSALNWSKRDTSSLRGEGHVNGYFFTNFF